MTLYYKTEIPLDSSIVDVLDDYFFKKKAPKTFHDEELTELQCVNRRTRSFDDTLLILSRFEKGKNLGLEGLIAEISNFNKSKFYSDLNNPEDGIFECFFFISYCTGIKKPTLATVNNEYSKKALSPQTKNNGRFLFCSKWHYEKDQENSVSKFKTTEIFKIVKNTE